MAIKITENGVVRYENEPNVDRLLFPNVEEGISSEQIKQAVDEWLEDHPEATTTVVDGSITRVKLDSELNSYIEDITNLETNKQDVLTFDSAPTAESTNPVTSVGIKNAIEAAVDVTAPGIYETASGSIASFADGADDLPMKSAVVNIEPIQEGSGDPSPENVRPISGRTGLSVARTGKNLLLKARQSSTMNGITWTLNDDGSITASGTSTGRSYIRITVYTRDAYTLPNGTYTYSLTPTGSDYTNIYSLIGSYKGNKYYKNVCVAASSNNFATVFEWNDSDMEAVLDIAVEVVQENKTVNCTIYPQIELGSTATDYEPYQGQSYSVNWETEAGTVYGGTLDVVSGKLTVDRAMVDLGTLTWEYISSDKRFYCLVYGWKEYTASQVANAICSQYYPVSRDNLLSFDKCFSISTNVISFINIRDTAYSDATTFKTAMNGVQFVYELATPTEIQLTPQEVRTLLGVNNIWSDAGDMAVEYPADTKMYIEKLTTPTEEDMIADHAISANSFFMVGNTLYRATTDIASGATITVGTNATKLSLSDALNSLS